MKKFILYEINIECRDGRNWVWVAYSDDENMFVSKESFPSKKEAKQNWKRYSKENNIINWKFTTWKTSNYNFSDEHKYRGGIFG